MMSFSFKIIVLNFIILAFLNPSFVKAATDDDDKQADYQESKRSKTVTRSNSRTVLGNIGNDMALVMTNSQPEDLSQKDLKDTLAPAKLVRTISEAPNPTNGDGTTGDDKTSQS